MARTQKREASAPQGPFPKPQQTALATDVARLLRATIFVVGPSSPAHSTRLTQNLGTYGGEVASPEEDPPQGAAWIGEARPKTDLPSVSLGDEIGTLGPHSFGFLNNLDGIYPLAAPMADRPRRGGVALVVPRRDALPEMVPLLLRRKLGISWMISVGDGDPADVVRFLTVDPATCGILLALGRGARALTLHGVLGDKQAVILEPENHIGKEGVLCRAVARRAGVPQVTELEEWLAHAALMEAAGLSASPGKRPKTQVFVVGAGYDLVQAEAQRARLPSPKRLSGDDPEELRVALAQAALDAEVIALCGDPEETALVSAARPLLRVDPGNKERLRALFSALAARPRPQAEIRPVSIKPDADRLQAIYRELPPPLYQDGRMVVDEPLSDHDTKRLLFAYGAKVSRQAPANTYTAAQRVATKIGLPVQLIPLGGSEAEPEDAETQEPICKTPAELKRQAILVLSRSSAFLVREVFPETPRARITITRERGLGGVLRIFEKSGPSEMALLPMLKAEAREIAEIFAERHGLVEKGLTELLSQIGAAGAEQPVTLELTVYLGNEPAVVAAKGMYRRES